MPLYVPLRREAMDQLREQAAKERRRPQQQAAYILEHHLLDARAAEPGEQREPAEAHRGA